MEAFLAYTILGLSLGAAYAVAAAGLVVTYTTSGVFNFSHGAIAMLSAYLYWQLRFDDGWGGQLPAPVAIVLVVFVFAPLFGMALERLVMRNLRDTNEATRIVITVAVLLACVGTANWVWGSPQARVPGYFFGATNTISRSLPVAVLWHDVTVLLVAGGLAIALYVFLNKTPMGVRMRAVVDSPVLTQLDGVHPDQVSRLSWALGAGIAALAGVLLSPRFGALNPLAMTLLVANVFAAAVFGRLRSLPLTFGGAMVVGLAVNYWTWFQSEIGQDWRWLSNLRPTLPMVLLAGFLLVLPQERLRGAVIERSRERFRVPTMRAALSWAVVFVAVVAGWASIMEAAPQIQLARALSFALIAASIVLLTGYSGELNLAPMTFAGIGAIVAYQVDVGPTGRSLQESTSVLAIVLAGLVCAVVGALVALPALRLRGLYLALATFAFAVMVSGLIFKQNQPMQLNVPFVGDGEDVEINLFTNGTLSVPRPAWFGIDFDRDSDLRQTAWIVLLAVLVAAAGLLLIAIRRSSYGLRLTALKDSPAASATLGMNIIRLKLSVFALSAAMAGIGGVFFAGNVASVTERDFEVFASLGLFMLVAVGGAGYVTGGVIGGVLFGAAFVITADFWGKLAVDYPSVGGLFEFWQDWFRFVGPAVAGIGLGRNPSGIASQLFDGYRNLTDRRARPATYAAVGVLAGLFGLAASGGIGNWTYVLASMGVLLALPIVVYRRLPDLDPKRATDAVDHEPTVDLDRLDLAEPVTADVLAALDAELGLTTASGLRR